MKFKAFISYASEDQKQALEIFSLLEKEGISPWIDVKNILPGQNWEAEISRALREANVVILLMSPRSVSKRGLVQREANEALERLRYKLPTDIYVIPLQLEPCEVPAHIADRLQFVDLTANNSWVQVKDSLRIASEQQNIQLIQGASHGPFTVFTERLEEKWDGKPGYEVEIEYPHFQSTLTPSITNDLNNLFLGRAYSTLVSERQKPWDQFSEHFETSHSDLSRNGRWEDFGIVYATKCILSLSYKVGWYGAGAAHPNTHFETFNFVCLDRLFEIDLTDFFNDSEAALARISEICIQSLCKEYWERTGENPDEHQINWFNEGAGIDWDNFNAFTISESHITFLFPPYQVSSYAMGSWFVDVPFYELNNLLRDNSPYSFTLIDKH